MCRRMEPLEFEVYEATLESCLEQGIS
jgi:hypothetical protein